jgi:hypothetical protein
MIAYNGPVPASPRFYRLYLSVFRFLYPHHGSPGAKVPFK